MGANFLFSIVLFVDFSSIIVRDVAFSMPFEIIFSG